jgi:hypothetical protein
MNIMETIATVDRLLEKGIRKQYSDTTEYSILLGDIQRLAQTNPDALKELRRKYTHKYLKFKNRGRVGYG